MPGPTLIKVKNAEPGQLRKDTLASSVTLVFYVGKDGKLGKIGGFDHEGYFKADPFILNTNLSNRDYFKRISTVPDRLAIEPIISRTNGEFEIVMAIRYTKDPYFLAAITMIPRTFTWPIVPVGIQMALIDRNGRVIMHTDSTKNMNENLVDELQKNGKLATSLKMGTSETFTSRYFDKECDFVSQPLSDFPEFFLVQIQDKALQQEVELKALLFASGLLLAVMAMVFACSFLVYRTMIRGSIRKGGNAFLTWIYPKPKYWNAYRILGIIVFSLNLGFLGVYFLTGCPPASIAIHFMFWFPTALLILLFPLIFKRLYLKLGQGESSTKPIDEKREPSSWQKFFPPTRAYVRWYSFLIFSKLCFFSLIPVCLFYMSSHSYFLNSQHHYGLFEFGSQWLERGHGKIAIADTNKTVFVGDYRIENNSTSDTSGNKIWLFDNFESSNLYYSRFVLLSNPGKKDPNFKSLTSNKGEPVLSISKSKINLKAEGYKTILPVKWNQLSTYLFYICFALSLVLIFILVYGIIRKIFGTLTPNYEPFLYQDRAKLKALLDPTSITNFIFVQGFTGSFKTKFVYSILEEFKDYKDAICEIDLLSIPDETEYASDDYRKSWEAYIAPLLNSESKKVFILKHFEYNFENPHTNRIKLNLMEKLVQKSSYKLIIISSIEPTGLLRSIEEAGNLTASQSTVLYEDVARWNVLLGKFANLVVSINPKRSRVLAVSFDEELKSTEYLSRLSPLYSEDLTHNNMHDGYAGDVNDALLIDLQTVSIHFYRDIWTSFSPEEKVMVFDLAEEGLMNTSNYMTLFALIRKGIIVREEGVYYLINESFRHFLLSSVSNKEIAKAENEIDEKSIWKDFQGPILVVMAALLWFVLYANQDQFGQVFPMITALATGIPTLIKLFSLFVSGPSKA